MIDYVCGNPDVKLDEAHRFTKWMKFPYELESWERHFQSKGMAYAIGRGKFGLAIFLENEMVGG